VSGLNGLILSTRQEETRGIQLMVLGACLLPFMDAAAKSIGETLAVALVVLARFFFQTVFLTPLVWRKLEKTTAPALGMHGLRALSLCAATLCFFTAIQVMPIADALAIFFVMPLLVTLLSPWMLGETVGWRRLAAVGLGLIGAVILIQPGHDLFGWRAFLPLGTAISFAFYLMFTRKLARSGIGGGVPALVMQFYSGLLGAFIMVLVIAVTQPFDLAAFQLSWPEAWQWRQLVLVGLFAAIAHLVITSAFKYADASMLAPFQYIELVSAALVGWWFFGDIPSSTTWLGSAILVASGLYIFHRERVTS